MTSPNQGRLEALKAHCRQMEHGTRARYQAGCRCERCREANRLYKRQRVRANIRGERNGRIRAGRVRRHIRALARAGVGCKTVAEVSGIANTIVQGIKTGRRRWCREQTARAILAVTEEARADGSLVPAERAWRILKRLIEDGYTKVQLARWIGQQSHGLQVNRRRILARTELRIVRMAALIEAGKLRRTR